MTRRRTPSRGGGVGTVAVVGTGVIGASWAAHFLAHGLDVVATDPAPGAEERLRADVAAHWPVLEPVTGASPERLRFTPDPAAAAAAAGGSASARHRGRLASSTKESSEVGSARTSRLATSSSAAPSRIFLAGSSSFLPVRLRGTTGKKLELPAKKILLGAPLDEVASRDVLADPTSLDPFVALARRPR